MSDVDNIRERLSPYKIGTASFKMAAASLEKGSSTIFLIIFTIHLLHIMLGLKKLSYDANEYRFGLVVASDATPPTHIHEAEKQLRFYMNYYNLK